MILQFYFGKQQSIATRNPVKHLKGHTFHNLRPRRCCRRTGPRRLQSLCHCGGKTMSDCVLGRTSAGRRLPVTRLTYRTASESALPSRLESPCGPSAGRIYRLLISTRPTPQLSPNKRCDLGRIGRRERLARWDEGSGKCLDIASLRACKMGLSSNAL